MVWECGKYTYLHSMRIEKRKEKIFTDSRHIMNHKQGKYEENQT